MDIIRQQDNIFINQLYFLDSTTFQNNLSIVKLNPNNLNFDKIYFTFRLSDNEKPPSNNIYGNLIDTEILMPVQNNTYNKILFQAYTNNNARLSYRIDNTSYILCKENILMKLILDENNDSFDTIEIFATNQSNLFFILDIYDNTSVIVVEISNAAILNYYKFDYISNTFSNINSVINGYLAKYIKSNILTQYDGSSSYIKNDSSALQYSSTKINAFTDNTNLYVATNNSFIIYNINDLSTIESYSINILSDAFIKVDNYLITYDFTNNKSSIYSIDSSSITKILDTTGWYIHQIIKINDLYLIYNIIDNIIYVFYNNVLNKIKSNISGIFKPSYTYLYDLSLNQLSVYNTLNLINPETLVNITADVTVIDTSSLNKKILKVNINNPNNLQKNIMFILYGDAIFENNNLKSITLDATQNYYEIGIILYNTRLFTYTYKII